MENFGANNTISFSLVSGNLQPEHTKIPVFLQHFQIHWFSHTLIQGFFLAIFLVKWGFPCGVGFPQYSGDPDASKCILTIGLRGLLWRVLVVARVRLLCGVSRLSRVAGITRVRGTPALVATGRRLVRRGARRVGPWGGHRRACQKEKSLLQTTC